jgi:hypothetical protein
MIPELEQRRRATQATVDKYGARAFKWGSCDCAKIAAFHARKFGWKVPAPKYRSALGAAKYLKGMGCETLPDLIDRIGLKPIAPAFALTGDIVSFASDERIGAVGIVIGNGNMMAFHEAHETPVIMSMTNIDRAWSIRRDA